MAPISRKLTEGNFDALTFMQPLRVHQYRSGQRRAGCLGRSLNYASTVQFSLEPRHSPKPTKNPLVESQAYVSSSCGVGVVCCGSVRKSEASAYYDFDYSNECGYGAHRLVFVLPPHSNNFKSGPHHYMLWYTDERTAAAQPIADASEFTFYSGLSNIDFELGDGNPAAVAIRFNVAQHSFISQI